MQQKRSRIPRMMAVALAVVAITATVAVPVGADVAETTPDVLTIEDMELESLSETVLEVEDPFTGKLMKIPATQAVYSVEGVGSGGALPLAGCSVTYYAGTPYVSGSGPYQTYAVGYAKTTNGCDTPVAWDHDLFSWQTPIGWVLRDTIHEVTPPNSYDYNYASEKCASTATKSWLNTNESASKTKSLACSP